MSYASADFADKFPSLFDIPLSQALTDSLASRIMCEKLERYLERNEKCRDCSKLLICGGGCRASGLAGEGADHLCIDEITCYFHLNNWAEKSQEVADQTIERLGLK